MSFLNSTKGKVAAAIVLLIGIPAAAYVFDLEKFLTVKRIEFSRSCEQLESAIKDAQSRIDRGRGLNPLGEASLMISLMKLHEKFKSEGINCSWP